MVASYDTNGKKLVLHFDNATCHSRRSDHWLPHQEVQEGRMIKGRRVGGWGPAKCAAWLTGRASGLGDEVAMERCMLALGAMAVAPPTNSTLDQARKCVDDHLPPRGPRSRGGGKNYREIAMNVASSHRFAIDALLEERGFSSERTPPYEKRFNGTELWWASVKNFYRFASLDERKAKGVMGIVTERLGRTTPREAAGYMAHTSDFALAVAARNYDAISRVDCDLADALQKWDDARGKA